MVQILLLLIYISDILLTPLFGVHPLLIILPAIIATLTLYMFLKRVSIGEIRLGGVPRGTVRELRPDETEYLSLI